MTIEQIMKLVEAGYTKADIDAMMQTAVEQPVESQPEPVEDKPVEQEADQNDLLKEIKALRAALNLKNIHTDDKSPEVKESAEDILIHLLNGKEK